MESERVLEFERALEVVLEHARRRRGLEVERIGLLAAVGRVLAEAVVADRDQPPFDRATRDGFAVRAGDWAGRVGVIGEVRAGERWRGGAVRTGEAVAIMTGAPMPEGADAVAMVEHVERGGDWIAPESGRGLAVSENVVARGSEARVGQEVVGVGTRIGAAEVALAATCGCVELVVFRRPMVAIVATGDELVEVAEVPGEEQIRNSNGYAIAAMVEAAGGVAGRLKIARDVREEVWERVAQGRMWDLLIFSGGVSMGEYDLVEEVLAEFGAEFLFTGVKMQPGKPVVFGRLPELKEASGAGPECFFFGLPGNPISTQVTFHCFAEVFLRVLSGEVEVAPRWALATLTEKVQGRGGLTRLLPGRREGVEVRLVGWRGSGDLAANGRANCYVELLPGREYGGGEVVRVLLR